MSYNFNKTIWSFWEGPDSDLLLKCRKSWEKYLPDWNIKILNYDTIEQYNMKLPSTFYEMGKAMQSDYIRLNLLYNYGGIWLDATIKLYENFDWLIKDIGSDTSNYFQPELKGHNYYESWFIASPEKNNPNILKQLNLMLEIGEYFPNHHTTYIYDIFYKCNYGKPNQSNKKYYLIFQVYCYLIIEDETFKPPRKIKMNAYLSMFPYNIPFTNIKMKKYTSTTRKVINYTSVILLIILVIFFVFLLIKIRKHFTTKR